MRISFVDLKSQYQSIKSEIDSALAHVISDTAFVGGNSNKYVSQFEKDFADYLGVKHVVSCANGTDSLEILLEAYGIKAGAEVIVPALTWISTSEAVGRMGAKPIFIDVCEDTLLMNIDLVEQKITPQTKAIIPVHLYGNAMNMEHVMNLANKYRLIVIEDCAQSHGAKFKNRITGTFGHASSFSFYPGKNLGAYGDAGCITTNDDLIAKKCRMIANHGQLTKHNHVMEGRNSRLDGIHAAVLSVKLKYLNNWNSLRNEHAQLYNLCLENGALEIVKKNQEAYHVFHLFVIKSSSRDGLKKHLESNGIDCAIHYPTPLPFLKSYASQNAKLGDYPVAEKVCEQILSLPMFPEMNQEQIRWISDCILSYKP